MEQQLYELLRQCTVRLSGKQAQGTGFFVASGLILTCAHVVKDTQSSMKQVEVSWNGQIVSGQLQRPLSDSVDLALLQVPLVDHPCVYLNEEGMPFDTLYSYGYPDNTTTGDPATFSLEGRAGGQEEELKFKTGQARPGMSGAPLLNIRTGYVCGIVQKSRDRASDLGGRGIPIATVFRAFPELIDQQRQFHQIDKRWLNCHKDIIERMKYLEVMRTKYGSIELLVASNNKESFSLHTVFQPLKLRNSPLAAEDLEREQRRAFLGEPTRSENDPRFPFPKPEKQRADELLPPFQPSESADNGADALQKSPQGRMIVLGGPGTGKSTLLRYLMDEACQKAQTDYAAPIPIFISLAAYTEYTESKKVTLPEYLARAISEEVHIDPRYAETLWKAIREQQAFICLDGLDEVASGPRKELIKWINTTASGEKGNYWIISSRFTEYKNGQFKHSQFTEWELQPLNHALRLHLAQQIIPELCRLLHSSQESVDPLLFVKTLEIHAQATAWGENPLLFSLAATVFVSKGVLPTSRAALYRDVIDAILLMREPDGDWKETLWSVQAELALKLFKANQRTFTRYDLSRLLSEIYQERGTALNWPADKIVQRIIKSGTLEVVARETYGFRHQTFQEYLAAVGLSQRMISSDRVHGEDLAWKMHTYSRWTEVLRLMVGELSQLKKFSEYFKNKGKAATQNWLRKLIAQRMTEEGDPGNLGLALALKSFNEIAEVAWWRETTMKSLARESISIWIDELFNAVRENQQGKRERLQSLAQDISYFDIPEADEMLKKLVQGLWDPEKSIRDMACEVLQNLRQSPTESLIKALNDPDISVRQAALKVLGAQRKPVPLDLLLSALHDDNSDVCQVAIEAFVKQGEYIPIEQLLEFLHSDDPIVRGAAVDALGEKGEHAPLEPLLSALHDKKAGIRGRAVKALAKLGDRVPIERLLAVLQDKSNDDSDSWALFSTAFVVWNVASEALAEQGRRIPLEFLLDRLHNGAGYERVMAAQALADHRDEAAIDPLIHTILYDSFSQVQRLAVEALAKHGERVSITFFLRLLHDENINIQRAAIEALGQRTDPASVEPLLSLLQDTDRLPVLGSSIVATLGKLGDTVSNQVFLALLRNDLSELRKAAADVIRIQQERFSDEKLLQALYDDDNRRYAALQVLERQGESTPFELLLSLVHDKNSKICVAALHLLEQQAERVPRQLLLDLLHNDTLRRGAIEVLRRQKESFPARLLMDFWHDQYMHTLLLDGLERSSDSPQRTEGLISFLLDRDEHTRVKAIEILSKPANLPPPDLLYPLLHDETDYVRQAAVNMLGKLGEQVPIDIFLQAMHDPASSVQNSAAIKVLLRLLKQQIREGIPIPEEYIRAVDDINYLIRPLTICSLWAEGEDVPLEAFLHFLRHKDHSIGITASVFLENGAKNVPLDVLLDLLGAKETYIKKSAIQAIGRKEDASLIEHILPFLRDEDNDIRKAVVILLGKHSEQVSIQQLLPLLHDPDSSVRYEVVKLLGEVGKHPPTQQLLPLLHDPDSRVRSQTVNVLKGYLPKEDLLHLLYDADSNLRSVAVTALGERGEDIPQEYFLEALGDEEGSVRFAAMDVLSKKQPEVLARMTSEAIAILQGQPVTTTLDSLSSLAFCHRAGELQLALPALLDELTKLLNWPHWQVRISATKALGSIHRSIPNNAIRSLRALRHQDPVHTVRKAADDALAEILSLETSIEEEIG